MEEMRIYIVFFSVFEVDKKIWIFLCFLWKDLVYYRSWSENLLITDNCFDHLLSQNAPDYPVSASQLWGFVAFLCLLWWWSEPFGVLDCWLEASSHRNYVGHDCFIDWMLVKRHCLLCWHFSVQIIFFIAPGPTCVQRQRPVDRRRKSSHPLSVKAEGHLHHHPLCLFHTGFTPLPHVWGVYVCTTQFFFFLFHSLHRIFLGRGTLSQLPTPTGHLLHRMLAGIPSTGQIEQMIGSDSAFNVCICWRAKNGLKVMGSEEASNSADRNSG